MTKFYERPGFAKLNKEWQGKLKRSGFMDIEDERERLRIDHCNTNDVERQVDPGLPAKTRYFELVRRWLHVRVWSCRLHKRLWELHGEGVGVRMATVRLRPMVFNAKAENEKRIKAERAMMFEWSASDPMLSESELPDDDADRSLFAQAMAAEGWSEYDYDDGSDE